MEKIATEEVMDNLDKFQSRFGKIDKFGWWDSERISSDAGTQIYYNGVQRRMPNSWSSFDISGSGTSGNKHTSQSDMENVAYNCPLYYGTC